VPIEMIGARHAGAPLTHDFGISRRGARVLVALGVAGNECLTLPQGEAPSWTTEYRARVMRRALIIVAIRAVAFDIGGVLEITPDLGIDRLWEARLGLPAGEINERMGDVWTGGSLGTIILDEVHLAIKNRLGLNGQQLAEYMGDLWREYLGTANTELIEYARRLRPQYRTAIVSNSFVGAREREQEAYGLEDLVDEIVYSHETGMSKPDPRIYALTCQRLDVFPEEMIFLDDVELCVAGARDAGIHAVLYQDNAQAIAEIEKLLGTP
jgi:epoxide hydrolase-like predicted phosphatase